MFGFFNSGDDGSNKDDQPRSPEMRQYNGEKLCAGIRELPGYKPPGMEMLAELERERQTIKEMPAFEEAWEFQDIFGELIAVPPGTEVRTGNASIVVFISEPYGRESFDEDDILNTVGDIKDCLMKKNVLADIGEPISIPGGWSVAFHLKRWMMLLK
ncbi:MAG: hypothetical protein GF349_01010 [Candidatus Magasanikbacteria bacterium]|nr:hypothetical protein [Candidatus Magasanikbacteria bacterium]